MVFVTVFDPKLNAPPLWRTPSLVLQPLFTASFILHLSRINRFLCPFSQCMLITTEFLNLNQPLSCFLIRNGQRLSRYCIYNISDWFYSVEFTVGPRPVNHFRMIEKHFFRDTLLKTFDFEFGFCIPFSRNTCEHIYEFPTLPPDLGKSFFYYAYWHQLFYSVFTRIKYKISSEKNKDIYLTQIKYHNKLGYNTNTT